jgi:micrococcal nuclease
VVRVVDGDSIIVRLDGREHRVRYIGVNTPESVDPRREVQCYGREAAARNRALVDGKTVWLERDVSDTDQYDRLLRYVYADGLFVNAELIREGYARLVTYPPDVKHTDRLRALEREARAANRGLWGSCAG